MDNFRRELVNNGFSIIRNALPNYKYYLNLLEKSDYEVHQDFLWDLRVEVKKYFELIYNSENLACSFDAYRSGDSPALNWHIDQNQSHPDKLNCPENKSRKSLALYYFSIGRPKSESNIKHSTIFLETQNNSLTAKLIFKKIILNICPPVITKVIKKIFKRS